MNKFWTFKTYFAGLVVLFILCVPLIESGCRGLVNPVTDAERAFKADVKKDIKILHEKIDGVEDRIEKAVRDATNDLVGCKCDPTKVCNCGDKPAPVVVDQWYQSQENANIYFWGHVVDGTLYYTFWYVASTHQTYRVITGSKTATLTKNFLPQPVKGMVAPAK